MRRMRSSLLLTTMPLRRVWSMKSGNHVRMVVAHGDDDFVVGDDADGDGNERYAVLVAGHGNAQDGEQPVAFGLGAGDVHRCRQCPPEKTRAHSALASENGSRHCRGTPRSPSSRVSIRLSLQSRFRCTGTFSYGVFLAFFVWVAVLFPGKRRSETGQR